MTDHHPGNTNFFWATVFFRKLLARGIHHAVISPGSRSTPLTLSAAAHPDLKKHIILDERSAAFTALGIGKATNLPAVLICTSGTAVANYFPAVIEARQSGVPLILATADRPPRLRNTGANQSINQQHIFGDYPVFFKVLGIPTDSKTDLNRLRALAKQAVEISREKHGPVHLNFPFDKPLEPEDSFLEKISRENKKQQVNANSNGIISDKSFSTDDETLATIDAAEHPLIIAGQLSPAAQTKGIFNLAKQLQAPVLSEQKITNLNYAIQGFDGFLRNTSNLNRLSPDLILRFGLQPASKSVLQAVKYWGARHRFHFRDTKRVIDIAGTTTKHIQWNGKAFELTALRERSGEWLRLWKQIESDYFDYTAKQFSNTTALTDGHIYRHLIPHVPDGWFIFISNSFGARDQSLFAPFGRHQRFTNRGASGIDGITSTAMGTAIGSDKPGMLITGDLSFLHDSNALLSQSLIKQPLVIVIINNGGGDIFKMLPVEKHNKYFKPYFKTPQSVDIEQLVRSHGIPYQQIGSVDALYEFDLQQWVNQHPSLSVVECITDSNASMVIRKKLWDIKI